VIFPGQHDSHESKSEKPAKLDRWLVGLLAGAALMYFGGKLLGLGKSRPAQIPDDNTRTINNADS
jgi:hypothetical protein